MTSIRLHFRPSVKKGLQEGKLFFRLIHRRKTVNLPTDYKVFPREWDPKRNELIFAQNDLPRLRYLINLTERIQQDVRTLEHIASRLAAKGEYDVKEVARLFSRQSERENLLDYSLRVSARLIRSGQERTARAYVSAVKSIYEFTEGEAVALSEIEATLIKEFEMFLADKGLSRNTISFYMRNLRALYNRAIQEGLIRPQETNPFEKVFTGISESERRALSAEELNSLARLDTELSEKIRSLEAAQTEHERIPNTLTYYRRLRQALYYFLFCYHARGMSFVDLVFLKKTDLQADTIVYKRKKTGGCLRIRVTEPMRRIIDYFQADTAASKYLFPIIDPAKGNERKQYETGLSYQNHLLGCLSRLAGLQRKVTTHVSRHTWATLAKHANIPTAVISEALGHKNLTTTDRYLASFETTVLDQLSEKMSDIIGKTRKAPGKKKLYPIATH